MTEPRPAVRLVITAPDDDVWTCDKWMARCVWTSKCYALYGWSFTRPRARWVDRSRRSCGTLNPVTRNACGRCGWRRAKAEWRVCRDGINARNGHLGDVA